MKRENEKMLYSERLVGTVWRKFRFAGGRKDIFVEGLSI